MADEYSVTMRDDGQVLVLLDAGCKIDRAEILALLQELGLDPSKVTFLEPDKVGECTDLKGAPVIIPIDEETCDLAELDNAGRHCGQAGGRVIVLFGPGYSYDGLHPTAEKYGTQCGWSSDQLRDCISGEVDTPRDGAGAPVDRAEAREVKCKR